MGVDACIYIETSDGKEPHLEFKPSGISIVDADDCGPDSATHEVQLKFFERFYSPHYARGNWPHLAGILLLLMQAENVSSVWYFSDCDDAPPNSPTTLEDIEEMTRFWVKHGNRPYRED